MSEFNRADHAVVVGLGANTPGSGEAPRERLERALTSLDAAGLHVRARSRLWRSLAWPDEAQPPFLNAVAIVETRSEPRAVLAALLTVERSFGRQRGEPNAPRTLDLDLIAHGRIVAHGEDLILPHPRAHERLFVMGPLADIEPRWRHPVSGRTAAELAAAATVGRDAAPID